MISDFQYDSDWGTDFKACANAVPNRDFDDHYWMGERNWDFCYDPFGGVFVASGNIPLDTAVQRADQAVSRIFPFIDLHLKGKWNYDNLQVLFDKLP